MKLVRIDDSFTGVKDRLFNEKTPVQCFASWVEDIVKLKVGTVKLEYRVRTGDEFELGGVIPNRETKIVWSDVELKDREKWERACERYNKETESLKESYLNLDKGVKAEASLVEEHDGVFITVLIYAEFLSGLSYYVDEDYDELGELIRDIKSKLVK